jgi:[acyl-carrier-protein] S-malonyltransferase
MTMKKRAVVFAGQGAQFVGMGKDLAAAHPECQVLFDRASAALGFDLLRLCAEGPMEDLTKSDRCQPAIFVVSAACHAALRKLCPGFQMSGAAGLSLGEWTALYTAGVLSFEDTVTVLKARGKFMQEACEEHPGGMVSVMGLPLAELEKICAATGVQIANFNSPQQTVLSGDKAGIAQADAMAQAAKAMKTVVLPVAGAFHSRLMTSAATKLAQALAGVPFRKPQTPVVSNVTGRPHGEPDAIKQAMVRQVTSSVQWVSSIEWFKQDGVTEYVECGPGKVLNGLIKRIDKDAAVQNVQDVPALDKAVAALKA